MLEGAGVFFTSQSVFPVGGLKPHPAALRLMFILKCVTETENQSAAVALKAESYIILVEMSKRKC